MIFQKMKKNSKLSPGLESSGTAAKIQQGWEKSMTTESKPHLLIQAKSSLPMAVLNLRPVTGLGDLLYEVTVTTFT